MELPGANPADGLKKISEELKQKFDDAGMAKVEEFVDMLDEVKGQVEKGPAKILEEMKGLFDAFKGKIEGFMEDPAKLAPGGLASCAAWYGGAVVGKLKALSEESNEMLEKIKGLVTQIMEPLGELSKVLETAMEQLDATIKKLAKLPTELGKLAGSVGGPEDVAKIETGPMKKCLDTSGISSPLDSLAGLKGPLKTAIDAVRAGVENVQDFITNVPDKIQACFDIPQPLCFLQSAVMSQAPEAMTQLLDAVKEMRKLDMAPMQSMLDKVGGQICGLDPATVSEPVKKFADAATGNIEDLDKLVSGAKLASGGGGGAVAGAMGAMKKIF